MMELQRQAGFKTGDQFTAVWRVLIILIATFFAGCDKDNKSETDAPAPVKYQAPDAGYIKNPTFAVGADGKLIDWAMLQHSSNTSYALSSNAGVLGIERTGVEPWGMIRQLFRKDEVAPLLGKKLEFSADIATEFTDEYGEPMQPSGLSVIIKGVRAGSNPMFGATQLLSESVSIEPGHTGWKRYALVFDVPGDAKAVRIELNIVMTEGGVLSVRGPSLVEVQ